MRLYGDAGPAFGGDRQTLRHGTLRESNPASTERDLGTPERMSQARQSAQEFLRNSDRKTMPTTRMIFFLHLGFTERLLLAVNLRLMVPLRDIQELFNLAVDSRFEIYN
jgi:hypothetical protein